MGAKVKVTAISLEMAAQELAEAGFHVKLEKTIGKQRVFAQMKVTNYRPESAAHSVTVGDLDTFEMEPEWTSLETWMSFLVDVDRVANGMVVRFIRKRAEWPYDSQRSNLVKLADEIERLAKSSED